ncbi:hypothetical protein DNTS_025939, partial [Danionella cerebrum]
MVCGDSSDHVKHFRKDTSLSTRAMKPSALSRWNLCLHVLTLLLLGLPG